MNLSTDAMWRGGNCWRRTERRSGRLANTYRNKYAPCVYKPGRTTERRLPAKTRDFLAAAVDAAAAAVIIAAMRTYERTSVATNDCVDPLGWMRLLSAPTMYVCVN